MLHAKSKQKMYTIFSTQTHTHTSSIAIDGFISDVPNFIKMGSHKADGQRFQKGIPISMQKSVKCSIFPSMSRLCVNLCLFFVLIITSSPYVLKNYLAEYASAQYNWLFFLCLICSAHFFKALVNWGTQILLFTVKTISYLKLNLPWTSLYIRWPTSSATLRTGVCVW